MIFGLLDGGCCEKVGMSGGIIKIKQVKAGKSRFIACSFYIKINRV